MSETATKANSAKAAAMTKSYRSSLIFRVMMPTPVFVPLWHLTKHAPPRPAVTAVTNFPICVGLIHALRVSGLAVASEGLEDEEREPNHRKSDECCCHRGRGNEQRVEAFRRNLAQHGILAWLIRGALKPPQSAPSVCEPSHTQSVFECRSAAPAQESYPQEPIGSRQLGRRGACSNPRGGARRPWTYAL